MFANAVTLKKLQMEEGVCSVKRNLKSFDNGKILKRIAEPYKTNDFLSFD
jgi:hypothetical protein